MTRQEAADRAIIIGVSAVYLLATLLVYPLALISYTIQGAVGGFRLGLAAGVETVEDLRYLNSGE